MKERKTGAGIAVAGLAIASAILVIGLANSPESQHYRIDAGIWGLIFAAGGMFWLIGKS